MSSSCKTRNYQTLSKKDTLKVFAREVILAESRCGAPIITITTLEGATRLLHSSYDPVKEARDLVNRNDFSRYGILVVLGLGLGYHINEILNQTTDLHIIAVEAIPECAELAKQTNTITVEDPRITLLVGQTVNSVMQRIADKQFAAGMPKLGLFTLPSAISALPDYYQPLKDKIEDSVKLDLAGRLRYSKFCKQKRVLLFDCNYFLTRELDSALRQCGYEVDRLAFNQNISVNELLAALVSKIAITRPDFCLTINHLGFDDGGILTQFLQSIQMPVASWFVDSPDLIIKGFGLNVSPFSAIFTWDSSFIKSLSNSGFSTVHYLPLATDPAVFSHDTPIQFAPTTKNTAQVGFVGTSMVDRMHEKLSRVDKSLHPVVKTLAGFMSRENNSVTSLLQNLDKELSELINTLNPSERIAFEAAVTWQATMTYRLRCLKQLAEFRPVIHGDSKWRELLDKQFTLRAPLDYYRALPRFYSTCSVNFNATNLQMGTAVNQRVFDVPAAGGFLLTDYQASLEEMFLIGEEVITYRDVSEIRDLSRHYLENPSSRNRVVTKARERILKQHTYKHRLHDLLMVMNKNYS